MNNGSSVKKSLIQTRQERCIKRSSKFKEEVIATSSYAVILWEYSGTSHFWWKVEFSPLSSQFYEAPLSDSTSLEMQTSLMPPKQWSFKCQDPLHSYERSHLYSFEELLLIHFHTQICVIIQSTNICPTFGSTNTSEERFRPQDCTRFSIRSIHSFWSLILHS